METTQVTFTQHYTDVVNTKYGTKTKNTFVTDDGDRYESWNTGIAAKVAATLDTPVNIVFERKQSGQYTNLEIKDVLGGTVVGTATPAPTQTTVQVNAPVTTESQDERQTRIMRQSGLKAAIQAFGVAELDPVQNTDALYQLAEEFVDFYLHGSPVEA